MLPDFLIGPRAAVREAIAGRASGIFNMAGFAVYWAALGVSALPAPFVLPGLVIALIASGLAFAGASQLRQQARGLPAGSWNQDQVKRFVRTFGLIGAAEALGVGVTVLLCGVLARHWEWLGPAIAIPVGLHFFGLARLFRVPLYNLTGAALCAVALATFLWIPARVGVTGQLSFMAGAPAPLWRLVPGLAVALVLWMTCGVMFVGGREIIGQSRSSPAI